MLKSIDRHILRREIGAFAAVLLVVTLMLAIENVPRIWDAVSQTSSPIWLLQRMVLALLPEYLAIGVTIASFVAPAWVIRTMALRGEWQVMSISGAAPWRVMLAPLLIAGVAAGGQLMLHLVLEPQSERQFDDLGNGLDRGAFGLPIRLHEFVALDSTTTILLMPATRPDRHFGKVFLHRGPDIFTATSANAHRDPLGRVEVELFDGRRIGHDEHGDNRVLDFATFRFSFSPSVAAAQAQLPSERISRLPPAALLGGVLQEHSNTGPSRPITASVLARVSNALFCILAAWLAYALAPPPRREKSGAGIAVGVGLLVLFLRTNSLVETGFAQWPVTAALVHLAIWIGVTAALVRFAVTHDEGAIDHALNRGFAKLVSVWTRLRQVPRYQAAVRVPSLMQA